MSDLSNIIITGRMGKDPEVRTTKNGTQYVSLSVASSTRKDETVWRYVNCYGSQADFAQKYLRKGSRIHVQGEERAYASLGQDGQPRAQLIIEASHIGILDSPRSQNNDGGNAGGGYANAGQNQNYAQQPQAQQFVQPPQMAQNQGYTQPPMQNQGYVQQPQAQPQQPRAPRNGNYYDQQYAQQPQAQPQQAQPQGMPNLDISSDDLPF